MFIKSINRMLRSDIINVLFKWYNFQSYLEIGVAGLDATFNLIKASFKESVDPRVDPNNIYTYNTTSDDFFKNYAVKKYDVIFIDGLHTEDQIYKDIYNAINYLEDGGVIVLHDCNPSTEDRIATNNGTVFKGFIRAKKELKDWSCFVVDEDDGCGIITKRKILKNKIYDTPELTWDVFVENRNSLLQLISFEQYVQML